MDKTYNPNNIEKRWYELWEERGYFAPQGDDESYCIMIPPPNVTGRLHMGHAFQDTIMDTLIRYNRMKGKNTLWQAGMDHAGIATQMVVERNLKANDKTRYDLGREAFIEKVWQWKKESGGTITQQLRRMGASLDWSRERFTMDDGLSDAVKEVFVKLFEENLIYRGKRLVNWDPVLHTAVSDIEVISEEENGHLWQLRYPLADDESSHLVVATTRPETMLGDAAVAVHPDDERYKHLVGKKVKLPLVGREIAIIADDYVDKDFGTGCVKITPAHDFNDYQMGLRHELEQINIFTIDAAINENAPEKYQGLDRFIARKTIVADLKELNLLEKIEKHKLKIPRGDRTGAVIEPYLTDQWFVKVEPLAKPAIEAVENGSIKFVPDNWKNTYFDWMRNIQDWCISRQIWWGHRIPAWYDEAGNIYVARSEAEVREKYQLNNTIELKQDEDVLDTWFSSALWPFSTLGWPEKTKALETFYPGNVLVTGFDIIFFWVARMIMMGLKFTGQVPFHEIYMHGLVRDSHGVKMSKSYGNVLDPIDLIDGINLENLVSKRTTGLMKPETAPKIEKQTRKDFPDGIMPYGTDALRFTFAAMASTSRDINFDTNRIQGYRNFCNKLWNAARYVLMNTEEHDCGQNTIDDYELNNADRWIISRLQETEAIIEKQIKVYRFDIASQAIYDFTWNEYCDWYLELTKSVLNNKNSTDLQLRGTRKTLVRVLEALLRLAHPIIPYITEEIWQRVAPLAGVQGETIMLQQYPIYDSKKINISATKDIDWVREFILGVRQIRSGYNIDPKKPINVLLSGGTENDRKRTQLYTHYLESVGRIESIRWLDSEADAPDSATALVADMKVLIPMDGLIEKAEEVDRLNREIEKKLDEQRRLNNKLSNENFVNRAPAVVIEKEQIKLDDVKSALSHLKEQLERINSL